LNVERESKKMIRSRFQELKRHLQSRLVVLGIAREQFSAEIAKLKVLPGGHEESEAGNHLCTLVYECELYFERLPKANLALLACLVAAHLEEHDDTRRSSADGDPEFTVVDLDDEYCDVMLAVNFRDPVFVAPCDPDEPDALEYLGAFYAVRDFEYFVAEDGTVERAPLHLGSGE